MHSSALWTYQVSIDSSALWIDQPSGLIGPQDSSVLWTYQPSGLEFNLSSCRHPDHSSIRD